MRGFAKIGAALAITALVAAIPALQGRAEEATKSPLEGGSLRPDHGAWEYFSPVLEGGVTTATAKSSASVAPKDKPVNRGNAMLRSLLVPGWGESYLGYHTTARRFFWTDMLIWAGVIGLETYSNWKEDQFMALASQHAGAQMAGKNDAFYADIGNYNTTQEYNEAKIRDRNFDAVYTDASYFWSWDNAQNRQTYDHTRILSRSAHNKLIFFIGAAALNRLVSLIDTGKKANDVLNRPAAPAVSLRLEPGSNSLGNPDALRLVMTADLRP